MYKYNIIDNSGKNQNNVQNGKATLKELKDILPNEIFEQLQVKGTEEIKVQSGHEIFEIKKIK